MCRRWCPDRKNSGGRWPRRNSAAGSNSATTCTGWKSSLGHSFRPRTSGLSQSGDLYDHIEIGRALPRVDALQRGHIGVVAADAHADVLLGDLGVVGGVVV